MSRFIIRGVRPALALALTLVLTAAAGPARAGHKVKVVASVTDLGSVATTVGGDHVDVKTIARPNADPHRVEVLPSYMVRVSRADLYLKVGLSLDRWADQIIDGSRNAKLKILDCSQHIAPLEKPTTRVDARQGDVHPNGNPHYWLDPANLAIVARDVADALSALDPEHAAEFAANAEAFGSECRAARADGAARINAMGEPVALAYHASWVYFCHATGLEMAGHVEPVPGIPPTGGHLQELVTLIGSRDIGVLIEEPYFSRDSGKFLARQTGIRVEAVSPSCDDVDAGSTLDHFRTLVDAVTGSSS